MKTKSDKLVIDKLSNKKDESFISTGINEIDDLIGGGLARGRITELSGNEGVGKTHLVSVLMANLSKEHKVLFIDAEFSLNKARVSALGGKPANIAYLADSRLENVCEALIKAVGEYDIVILDSLASLIPMTIENQEIGESSNIGLYARLIKQWVMKFRPRLGKSRTAFVAINQMRKPIGMYARVELPGGMAWSHSCDVRLRLSTSKADKVMNGTKQTGHYTHVEVIKSKVSKPFLTTKFLVTY